MNTDGIFSSNEINVQNISELSRRQSVTEEQRICELAEIASEAADYALEMYNEGYGVYEILSLAARVFVEFAVGEQFQAKNLFVGKCIAVTVVHIVQAPF